MTELAQDLTLAGQVWHHSGTWQDLSIPQRWESWGLPVPYRAGWCLSKLDPLASRCWMPAGLEWHCGSFSSELADDGPSFTQEKWWPSPAQVLPSPCQPQLNFTHFRGKSLAGGWEVAVQTVSPAPLHHALFPLEVWPSRIHNVSSKVCVRGLNFRFVWPRNSQFCCMCSPVSPSPPRLSLGCETAQGDSLYAPNPEATQL